LTIVVHKGGFPLGETIGEFAAKKALLSANAHFDIKDNLFFFVAKQLLRIFYPIITHYMIQGGSQKLLLTTKEYIVSSSIFSRPSCMLYVKDSPYPP